MNPPRQRVGRRVVITEHVNVRFAARRIAAQLEAAGHRVTVLPAAGAVGRLPDCELLMPVSAFRCDEAAMAGLPSLRGIAALAAGTDSIDIAAATRRGIVVAHAPTDENIVGMAEATVLLMLASLYRLDQAQAMFSAGWQRPEQPHARSLAGKTVGLIGFGRIARAVAERLVNWRVRLLSWSPLAAPDSLPAHVQPVPLDDLLAAADVVSLHAALGARNAGLVDAGFLAKMKPDAVLVNTARGGLVDEAALVDALVAGRPGFAALDCFREEPLRADSPLRRLPAAILTPHVVGHTREAQQSLVVQGVRNAGDILQGVTPEFVRNPEVLERWLAAGSAPEMEPRP